jgi:two-component sensor histidine kinase
MSTLIDLQIERLKEPSTIQLFEDTQQRIHSMALIHEKLFQSPDLAKVDFGNYLRNLAEEIAYSYNFIQRNIQLEMKTL